MERRDPLTLQIVHLRDRPRELHPDGDTGTNGRSTVAAVTSPRASDRPPRPAGRAAPPGSRTRREPPPARRHSMRPLRFSPPPPPAMAPPGHPGPRPRLCRCPQQRVNTFAHNPFGTITAGIPVAYLRRRPPPFGDTPRHLHAYRPVAQPCQHGVNDHTPNHPSCRCCGGDGVGGIEWRRQLSCRGVAALSCC